MFFVAEIIPINSSVDNELERQQPVLDGFALKLLRMMKTAKSFARCFARKNIRMEVVS